MLVNFSKNDTSWRNLKKELLITNSNGTLEISENTFGKSTFYI